MTDPETAPSERRAPPDTVVVVGAGVTGLATAVLLADRGWNVILVERLRDPDLPEASEELAQAAEFVARANQALPQDGSGSLETATAEAEFNRARTILDQFWGNQGRNILIDSHSLWFLENNGIPTDDLPRVRAIDMNATAAGPAFTAEIEEHEWWNETPSQSAWRLLLCRDWAAQPSLADFERTLRRAAESRPSVRLLFNTNVVCCSANDHGVQIEITGAEAGLLQAAFMVVADGGGRGSLARRLGVTNRTYSRERINFAVFRSSADAEFEGRSLEEVFSHNCFTDRGWLGLFCSGRALSAVVNNEPYEGLLPPVPAWQQLHARGVRTPLVEPPREITVAVSRCDRFVVDSRIWVAGDAAARGNPRFGLGVQFGLLWAGAIAEALGETNDQSAIASAAARYAERAEDIAETRTAFETLWIEILDRGVVDDWALGDPQVQAQLSEAIRDFSFELDRESLHFRACFEFGSGNGRSGNGRSDIKRGAVGASSPTDLAGGGVLTSALRQLGSVSIEISAPITERGAELTRVRFGEHNRLFFRFGDAALEVCAGTLEIRLDDTGFRVELRDALVSQKTEGGSAGRTLMLVRRVTFLLPVALLDRLSAAVPMRPSASMAPMIMMAEFRDGVEVNWGPLRTRMHSAQLRFTTDVSPRGGYRSQIEVLSGRLEPLALSSFAQQVARNSARWLTAASQLSSGLSDIWFDLFGRFSSAWIRRIEFELVADGGAMLTLHGLVPLSLYLPAEDADSLRASLLSPSGIAGLWRSYASGLDYCCVYRSP